MSKNSDSGVSIRQLMKVSLVIIGLICVAGVQKKAEYIEAGNENLNVAEMQYDEDIVPNDENDYIYYKEKTYLEKREVTNVTSRGTNIKREVNKEDEKTVEKEVVAEKPIEEKKSENREEVTIKEEILVPPTEYKEVIEAKATAYCLCKKCCGKSETHPEYGITASGLRIVPGTNMKVIAVDPKVIPLGTKVYVEGVNGAKDYGYAVAADTGSAIKNLKIDLYMDSHQTTLNWGVKNVKVYVLD